MRELVQERAELVQRMRQAARLGAIEQQQALLRQEQMAYMAQWMQMTPDQRYNVMMAQRQQRQQQQQAAALRQQQYAMQEQQLHEFYCRPQLVCRGHSERRGRRLLVQLLFFSHYLACLLRRALTKSVQQPAGHSLLKHRELL